MRLKTIAQLPPTQGPGRAQKTCLPADEVHIWSAGLRAGRAVLCTCWDLLSAEEKRFALAHRFAKDRREFVVTRALLRNILAHYAGQAAAYVCFDSNSSGKPLLRGTEGLHFSVSHSHDLALFVIARRRVGIDVEYIRSSVVRKAVIDQCLSLPEQIRLQAMPAKVRALALYRCWTKKEAILKAVGVGLSYSPRHVNVLTRRRSHVVCALGRRWFVRQIAAPAGYAAAAAIEEPHRRLRWHQRKVQA
jgi:4'-phosphopantetheinyl transferase